MASEEQVAGRPAARASSALPRLGALVVGLGDILANVAAFLATFCLCALLLLVLVQTAIGMLARSFPVAASMMSVSWEYAGYLMGSAFMFGLAQTLRLGGHIRVNLLFNALKPPVQRAADFIASAVSFATMAVLAAALTGMATRAFLTNSLSTASLTPLWIPQGAFALAAWLFTFQLLVRMVALLAGLPPEEEREYVGAPSE